MDTTVPQHKNIPMLKKALAPLGYTFKEFLLDGTRFTQFTNKDGQVWITNSSALHYPFVSSSAKAICKNKTHSYELVQQLGMNIPFTQEIASKDINSFKLDDRLLACEHVIVKPLDSTLSKGLTLDITSRDHLYESIEYALEYASSVLVQEQVYGDEIRFLVLNGKVESALLRQTPRVIGDGKSTVKQLIQAENEIRRTIKLPYGQEYVQLTTENISADYLQSEKVLESGEVLELSKRVLLGKGASIYDVLPDVHPSYVETAEKLANTLGKGLIAVDIMFKDYTQPQTQDNYWFIEFNSSPAIGLAYCMRDGKHFDLLAYLAPMIDKAVSNSKSLL